MKEKSKRKIIILTTGGTIGSILHHNSLSVDKTEKQIIHEIECAKKYLGYTIEIVSPLNKNSESFYPKDWVEILHCLDSLNQSDADGIIVTHGTDTMVYSVAATLSYNELWKKKICFTGSFYPPDHPSSDASLNLLAALEFSASNYPSKGIYVAFRSNKFNSEAKIIYGADIKPMTFDNEFFESVYGKVVSTYSKKKGLSEGLFLEITKTPSLGTQVVPSKKDIEKAQSEIACITLYPGIDRILLENISKGRKVIIITMYHSGTGPTDNEKNDLIQFLQSYSKEILILMATFPKKHIDTPYSSTRDIQKAGAYVYSDLQQHFLYVFSLLSLSTGKSPKDLINKLSPWEV